MTENKAVKKFENIPAYLRENGLFCLWRYETDDRGRKTKMPYNPNNPQYRSDSTKKEKFAPLEVAAARSGDFDGIGIGIFDNIAAIDIDHCIDGGELSAMAADIVDTMDAYTEKSPSGEGLRLLFLVTSDFQYDENKYYINNRKSGLEIYLPGMTNKYVTITGDTLRTRDIVDRSDRLQPVLDKYMMRPEQTQTAPTIPTTAFDISDSDLIEKAKAAKNGARFTELWSGGLSVYPSPSEADIALCDLLAFWTGKDAGRMKSLFLHSGLNRQGGGKYKNPAHYDRYLDKTISKAIASCNEVYTPRQNAPEAPQSDFTSAGDKNIDEREKMAQNAAELENKSMEAKAAAPEPAEESQEDIIDSFLSAIYTERYKPIKTGMAALDTALGGGFISQTLICLGAEPAAGKTILATMIFETMARAGHPALYFNLEMSREQLIARSLARIVYENDHSHKLTALDILQGYKQTDETKKLVLQAAQQYRETIAPNLAYNPGKTGTGVTEILKCMDEKAKAATAAGKPAPNVCIDYLQIMTGEGREDTAEIIKRAVAGLKDYARKYNTIVFCIMAQSRGVNNKGEATLSAGRDSSAIEYGTDTQLQMLRKDEKEPDDITLYVTKSRFTKSSLKDGIYLKLNGAQSCFEVLDHDPASLNWDDVIDTDFQTVGKKKSRLHDESLKLV